MNMKTSIKNLETYCENCYCIASDKIGDTKAKKWIDNLCRSIERTLNKDNEDIKLNAIMEMEYELKKQRNEILKLKKKNRMLMELVKDEDLELVWDLKSKKSLES